MTIHKEGYITIGIAIIVFAIINSLSMYYLMDSLKVISYIIFLITLLFVLFIISFFRVPSRILTYNETGLICPADGKVVVIEEITDEEYFKDKRIQISIFMSPANVHINRSPLSGEVVYSKYHKGKYLVAWHPKSSTENERWSVVVKGINGEVLFKQIAGAVARRICNYATVGKKLQQNEAYGFIKFGSRVDILVPLNAKIAVEIGQKVKGGVTPLAYL